MPSSQPNKLCKVLKYYKNLKIAIFFNRLLLLISFCSLYCCVFSKFFFFSWFYVFKLFICLRCGYFPNMICMPKGRIWKRLLLIQLSGNVPVLALQLLFAFLSPCLFLFSLPCPSFFAKRIEFKCLRTLNPLHKYEPF